MNLQINIPQLLEFINNEQYCFIKFNNSLEYLEGSDFDIFCYNASILAGKIIEFGHQYIDEGFTIEVKEKQNNIYVDFMLNERINLRFDIYDQLPPYKNLCIKSGFFNSVLEGRQTKTIDNYTVFIPSKIDDYLLRYIEYIEWYKVREDKVKHLNFIIDNINSDEKKLFFDKLHFYTSIPQFDYKLEKKKEPKFLLLKKIKREIKRIFGML